MSTTGSLKLCLREGDVGTYVVSTSFQVWFDRHPDVYIYRPHMCSNLTKRISHCYRYSPVPYVGRITTTKRHFPLSFPPNQNKMKRSNPFLHINSPDNNQKKKATKQQRPNQQIPPNRSDRCCFCEQYTNYARLLQLCCCC